MFAAMLPDMKIIRLDETSFDAQKLSPLLRKSQSEGYNLVLRLSEGWESGENRFDKPGEAFFAVEHEGRWLAVGGRSLDPYLGDAGAIRVRHVYVLPEWRGAGVGSALMKKILDIPPGMFHRVTLRSLNPIARKFYERLGFTALGDGPVTHELPLAAPVKEEGAGP